MKIVWVVEEFDYDSYSRQGIYETAEDAYANRTGGAEVEPEMLYEAGESPSDHSVRLSELSSEAYMRLSYIPALRKRQEDGRRLTKAEKRTLEEYDAEQESTSE